MSRISIRRGVLLLGANGPVRIILTIALLSCVCLFRLGSGQDSRDLTSKARRCKLLSNRRLNDVAPAGTRFTRETLSAYLEALRSDETFEGWLTPTNVFMVGYLSRKQHDLGNFGSVGEIGVHHGKFTAALSGFASPRESVVAYDLFSLQKQNTDGSGKGDSQRFKGNLDRFDLLDQNTQALEGNSFNLKAAHFSNYASFRLFSVDGGHTESLTLNDLLLTCSIIHDGGIVILDDFINMDWLGVVSGAFEFMRSQSRLVPFLWMSNKLYFTTADSHGLYVAALKNLNGAICNNRATTLAQARDIFPTFTCIVNCVDDNVVEVCDMFMSSNTTVGLL